MQILKYPTQYQSAFREACFVVKFTEQSIDVGVHDAGTGEKLGVKRVYGPGEASVNVSPYARRSLDPVPLCGKPMGIVADERRTAACRITVGAASSETVRLTGGTENPALCSILSEAPQTVRLRPGEKDEISVIADGLDVKPILVFSHGGSEYSFDLPAVSGRDVQTFVVDFDEAARKFSGLTGAGAESMTGFSAWLRIGSGASEVCLRRDYEADRTEAGCRLAWLNGYGAVDYYTFPTAAAVTFSAAKERIRLSEGCRTVATSTETSREFVSAAETARTLEWLTGIISSPRVWIVDGSEARIVDVADGSANIESLVPGTLRIRISPVGKSVSRNF